MRSQPLALRLLIAVIVATQMRDHTDAAELIFSQRPTVLVTFVNTLSEIMHSSTGLDAVPPSFHQPAGVSVGDSASHGGHAREPSGTRRNGTHGPLSE